MSVYFYDRDTLKKELKSKSNKSITIRFKTHKSIVVPKNILQIIQNIAKTDRKFIKNLLSNENNFIFFLTNFIKK